MDEADYFHVNWLEVIDDETKRAFHTTPQNIRDHGILINHCGPQLALPLRQWRKGTVAAPAPRQLTLLEATV